MIFSGKIHNILYFCLFEKRGRFSVSETEFLIRKSSFNSIWFPKGGMKKVLSELDEVS
jgi:hypothetical protein